MEKNKRMTTRQLFKEFLDFACEIGGVVLYIGVILCAISYKAYGIIPVCVAGIACTLYTTLRKGCN
ncbi:MAG: hypothetical protein WC333_01820 [Dehalococcoidia bacterium]|jgi:hypothetical protein